MSEEPPKKKIPVEALLALEIAKVRASEAQLQYELMMVRIERDHGFRFSEVVIAADGTIIPRNK